MTITQCAFWSHNGKYILIVEDDLKDTEAEGHFDILSNRLDSWDEKKLKYSAVLGNLSASCVGSKDNRLSTKVGGWLQDHKVEYKTVASSPSSTSEISANMRTIFELDADTLAKWTTGKVQLKSLSTKSWPDVRDEITTFIEAYRNEKKGSVVSELVERINTAIAFGKAQFPGLLAETKVKGKETKVVQLFRKAPDALRAKFAQWIVTLDSCLAAIPVVETLVSSLKTFDRVFYFADPNGAPASILGKLFSEDMGLQQQFFAPQDENRDEVSDKDLATCLDLFAPKKTAKKKKKGKKKATSGTSTTAGGGDDDNDDDDEEESVPAAASTPPPATAAAAKKSTEATPSVAAAAPATASNTEVVTETKAKKVAAKKK